MSGRLTAGRALTCVTISVGTLLAVSLLPVSALIAASVLVVSVAVWAATVARVRAAASTFGAASLPATAALISAMLLALIGGTAVFGLSGAVAATAALAVGVYLCRPEPSITSGVSPAGEGGGSPHDADAHEPAPMGGDPGQRLREARELSDLELCKAWRISYLFITRVSDPASIDRIARMRQEYLDEIQRRDPPGFDRWMDSGARAASNPQPFLTNARRPE